jgi:hypothetical protein
VPSGCRLARRAKHYPERPVILPRLCPSHPAPHDRKISESFGCADLDLETFNADFIDYRQAKSI